MSGQHITDADLKLTMAQLLARLTGDQEIAGWSHPLSWHHSFVEIDHELFSVVMQWFFYNFAFMGPGTH